VALHDSGEAAGESGIEGLSLPGNPGQCTARLHWPVSTRSGKQHWTILPCVQKYADPMCFSHPAGEFSKQGPLVSARAASTARPESFGHERRPRGGKPALHPGLVQTDPPSDNLHQTCHVVWPKERRIGVTFD
jgi:hypothetical protein